MSGDAVSCQAKEALNWEDVFQLPDAAYAGRKRIPKTVLVKQALLTRHEERVLDKVQRLEHFATVQKSTTRILPLMDEDHDIQSIVFLRCDMPSSRAYSEVARLVHKCFPNPTVILFDGDGSTCISVASTRKSRSEQGAMVIEKMESTGAFAADDERYVSFLDALSFAELPQDNLLKYLEGVASNIQLSKAIGVLGYFPACNEGDEEFLLRLLSTFDLTSRKANELADQRKTGKSLTLNESSKLRIEQKRLEKEAARLAEQIKEICHE